LHPAQTVEALEERVRRADARGEASSAGENEPQYFDDDELGDLPSQAEGEPSE
jgi:hypothetical protein